MDSKTQEGKSYKMKYTEMLQLIFVSTFFKMSPIIHSRLKLYLTMSMTSCETESNFSMFPL